jgi:hypothetical protein
MTLSIIYLRKISFILLTSGFLITGITSCNKKDYPCPGLGKSEEADISMFDENGKLKEDNKNKGRINKSSGLVNKKKPKRLQAQRKTRL